MLHGESACSKANEVQFRKPPIRSTMPCDGSLPHFCENARVGIGVVRLGFLGQDGLDQGVRSGAIAECLGGAGEAGDADSVDQDLFAVRLGEVGRVPGIATLESARLNKGLPRGCPASPVLFAVVLEEVVRDLTRSWKERGMGVHMDGARIALLAFADDVYLSG